MKGFITVKEYAKNKGVTSQSVYKAISGGYFEAEVKRVKNRWYVKNYLTMQELEDLGFEIVKSYRYDFFTTQVRQKGIITIETTYNLKTGDFESQETKVEDGFMMLSRNDIVQLDKIINHD